MTIASLQSAFADTEKMDTRWVFTLWNPQKNDRRDAKELFGIDDIVECAMREGFQNGGDCDTKTLLIKFAGISYAALSAAVGLDELDQRGSTIRRGEMRVTVDEDGNVPCMMIVDEGTGIGGPYDRASRPDEIPGGFQGYMRGTGNSPKGDYDDGSKGEGRTAIMRASTVGTVIVETKRRLVEDPATGETSGGETLVFGLSHMDHHVYRDVPYLYDGRFMIRTMPAIVANLDPLRPYIGEEGRDLMRQLGVERPEGLDGTTQLYPSVRPEFNRDSVVADVVRNQFIAVLRGLAVTVEDYDGSRLLIDADTIESFAANVSFGGSEEHAALVSSVRQLLEAMKAPTDIGTVQHRIADHEFDAGTLEALRERVRTGQPVAVSGEYHIRKNRRGDLLPDKGRLLTGIVVDRRIQRGYHVLVRSGNIVITNKAPSGVVTMSVSQDDAIAKMLRDGEDTSHTKWNPEKMAESASGWPKARAVAITGDFKTGAKSLYDILTGAADETENDALADWFGMPEPDAPVTLQQPAPGAAPDQPDPRPEPGPVPEPDVDRDANFVIVPLASDSDGRWGVSVAFSPKGVDGFDPDNGVYYLGFGYAQTEGGRSTWGKHSPADFNAAEFDLVYDPSGCVAEAVLGNVIKIVAFRSDFRVAVRGGLHPDRMIRVAEVALVDE